MPSPRFAARARLALPLLGLLLVGCGAGKSNSSDAPASTAPTITVQPAGKVVPVGETTTFSVAATGQAPLSYQWQKNGANIPGAGALSASYTTPPAAISDNGATFDVVVSDPAGSVTSNKATLTVTTAILASIAVSSPIPSAASGTMVQFQATGTYSDASTQDLTTSAAWVSSNPAAAIITQAGLATALIPTQSATISATYEGMSGSTALTVTAPLLASIAVAPANPSIATGTTQQFAAIGTYTDGTKQGLTASVTWASSNTAAATINATGSATGMAGTATITATQSGISGTTIMKSNILPQTVNLGQPATFMVAAGPASLSYQWQENGMNVAGATSPIYTTPATTPADSGATFDVVLTDDVTGNVASGMATLTVNAPPSIVTQPLSQVVNVGNPATFMVSVTGATPLSYQWQVNGTNITGAISSTYTAPVTTQADSGTQFTVVVTNVAGNVTSNAATLTVNPTTVVDVTTYHNDISRTGQNLSETILTPANVKTNFGKVGFFPVDGKVDAQPLYLSNLPIPGMGNHNVLFVATENDSMYAFDAVTGDVLWQTSVLGANEMPSDDFGCSQVTPTIGITGTPVIDRARGPNGAIYLVAMSTDGNGTYFQRIHALDVTTGAELFNGPTTIQPPQASYTPPHGGLSPPVTFDPSQFMERGGLLLSDGIVYTTWASTCAQTPSLNAGWIIGFDETMLTLDMTNVLNTTPNGSGGDFGTSGSAPAVDKTTGNIFLLADAGTFDTTLNINGFPSQGDFGNGFLKLSTSPNLSVADFFEISNQAENTNAPPVNLGSGGTLLLPDLTDTGGTVWHLAVGAGQDTNLYVVNRDMMGGFSSTTNNIYQEIPGVLTGGISSTPAYFNNTLYFSPLGSSIMAFGITNAMLSNTPASQTATSFASPGATPSISANSTTNAILWAVENNASGAILHAYDATNLATELYNSNQASGMRDQFGPANPFVTPTIANGQVYVGTTNGVAVFGTLPISTTSGPPMITAQPANQTINVGQTATFFVAVTGSEPLSLQWQVNGINIPGAILPNYTTPPVSASDDDVALDVMVTNNTQCNMASPPPCSVTSNVAILSVNAPPAISAQGQPTSQKVLVGETATFSVGASGGDFLSYQWWKNGMEIVGASSSSYTTPLLTLADSGEQFTVVVSDALGQVTSSAATLTVIRPISPAVYYVDFASGSDGNSGISKDSPWQYAPGMNGCALNCNLIVLQPGDSVIFKGGVTWNANAFPMAVSFSGTSGNPIYYGVDKSWPSTSWSRPVFDLSGEFWLVAPILTNSVSYVTFDNLEIKKERVESLTSFNVWPPRGSITVDGGSNITIENCYIHSWSIQAPTLGSDDNPFGGIAFFDGSTGGVVKNCTIDGGAANNSGVGIYGGTTIQGNTIENVPNGISVFDPQANVSGNQVFNITNSIDLTVRENAIAFSGGGSIYNNVIHDLVPNASALYVQSASDGVGNTQYIYNNLIWNVGSNPPVTVDPGNMNASLTTNQSILNNTLVGGAGACISVLSGPFPPTNLTVQNNHCISDLSSPQVWCVSNLGASNCGGVATLTFDTSNVSMNNATAATQGYTISNSFQPTGPAPGNSTVGAGMNLSSSCVLIGSSLCSDRLGVARPGSTAWDAGAYFYSPASNLAPSITTQPVSQSVASNSPATFTVVATGTGLFYQWLGNGMSIQGATSSIYTSPATSPADNGVEVSVVITNAAGSVTSSPAILTVNAGTGQLTTNASNPVDFGSVTVGTSATVSVLLTNSGNSLATISNTNVSGSVFNAYGAPAGLTLAPGQSATLNLTYTPTSITPVTGSVTVSSNATNSPLNIPLSGSGVMFVPPPSVVLSWTPGAAVTGVTVVGYNIYRGTQTGGPYAKLNSVPVALTQYTDTTVVAGQTYFYVVTAIDSTNAESMYSNEYSVTP